jgi:hypothetical protein
LRLFNSINNYSLSNKCNNYITTPLGKVIFEAYVGNKTLLLNDFDKKSYKLANGGCLISYANSNVILELALCEPTIRLPEHMDVEKVFGIVWRIKPLTENIRCKFITNIDIKKVNGGPDSGEDLDAITWDVDQYRATLGTQDNIAIVRRSINNDFMPNGIHDYEVVHYLNNELQVYIPNLIKNDISQVHFVLSWTKRKDEDDVSTWFAADMKTEEILSAEALY